MFEESLSIIGMNSTMENAITFSLNREPLNLPKTLMMKTQTSYLACDESGILPVVE